MPRVIAMMLLGSLVACGGRSELYDEDTDTDDVAAPRCPLPPNADLCPSAVSGATPIRGYCSTRASIAPHLAPTAPTNRWTVQLPTDRAPVDLLVDDCGRAYATFDPNLGASQPRPHVLVVLDPQGEMIAAHDYSPDAVTSLFIARDGTLRAVLGSLQRTFVRIDGDGEMTRLGALPEHSRKIAIASDETLLVTISDFRSPSHVARVTPDGTVLWTSPPLDDASCAGCLSDVAMFADDRFVVADSTAEAGTTVRCLDTAGAITWTRHVDGALTQGPAIAPDETIRLVTGVTDAGGVPTTLVTALSSDGGMLWQSALAEDYQQTWLSPIVIASDGATVVRSFGALTAIEPGGGIRWRIEGPRNLGYDAVVDTRGTLVMMLGGIVALDIATGVERWQVAPPGFVGGRFYFMSNLALGADGCVLGANHGGALFGACDGAADE